MATMVIDRKILPEQVISFFSSPRIAVMKQPTGDVVFSPVINPEDYDNDTDYLNAVPGMVDEILEARYSPLSEDVDVPEEWLNV